MDPARREEPEVTSRPRGEFALQQSGGKAEGSPHEERRKGRGKRVEERGLRSEGRGLRVEE